MEKVLFSSDLTTEVWVNYTQNNTCLCIQMQATGGASMNIA